MKLNKKLRKEILENVLKQAKRYQAQELAVENSKKAMRTFLKDVWYLALDQLTTKQERMALVAFPHLSPSVDRIHYNHDFVDIGKSAPYQYFINGALRFNIYRIDTLASKLKAIGFTEKKQGILMAECSKLHFRIEDAKRNAKASVKEITTMVEGALNKTTVSQVREVWPDIDQFIDQVEVREKALIVHQEQNKQQLLDGFRKFDIPVGGKS